MRRRILFYVQHLLGIGHLKRAASVARALADAGHSLTVVSGGEDVPVLDRRGFDFVQLPPVRAADRSFSGLVDPVGTPVDATYLAGRRAALVEAVARVRPDLFLVEMFPFGRRALSGEIVAAIAAARGQGAKIVCSVRDILVEKDRPEREAEMAAQARALFDLILVHGDPNLIAFDATFSRAADLADLIRYTGYVVDPPAPKGLTGSGEVIVSAGSGATGEKLLRTALAARARTSLAQAPWRLLVGQAMAEETFVRLCEMAGQGVSVERARPDFTTLLAGCALSISQGGYNTAMEVLAARVRSVVVPYGGGRETEQTLRARLLAGRGLIHAVEEDGLAVETLAASIETALRAPPADPAGIDMRGAAKTAEILASEPRLRADPGLESTLESSSLRPL